VHILIYSTAPTIHGKWGEAGAQTIKKKTIDANNTLLQSSSNYGQRPLHRQGIWLDIIMKDSLPSHFCTQKQVQVFM
jgi:hypothetical protein